MYLLVLVAVCLLDLTAAFDTMNHGLLEQRFGLRGIALAWFQSYCICQTELFILCTAVTSCA